MPAGERCKSKGVGEGVAEEGVLISLYMNIFDFRSTVDILFFCKSCILNM